jgi:rhodanese-related sulfurtransferase
VIHSTGSVGTHKTSSAATRIAEVNPHITVKTFEEKLTSDNALRIFSDFEIIADGTDNFATRYLVNDACVLSGKMNVYASVFRFEGQATVFGAKDGPCYRCLYPEPPPPGMVPSCAEGGVLGILPGLLGLIQATETIKLILGSGDSLVGRLLVVDALSMRFRELRIKKDPDCPVCGAHPTVTKLIDYDQFCGVRGDMPISVPQIQPIELKRRLDSQDEVLVLDVREPHEYQIANLGGRLIPLGQLSDKLAELDRDREIIVHCKSGGRSAKACEILRNAGFTRVANLAGGIDAWAQQVDPKLPRY